MMFVFLEELASQPESCMAGSQLDLDLTFPGQPVSNMIISKVELQLALSG